MPTLIPLRTLGPGRPSASRLLLGSVSHTARIRPIFAANGNTAEGPFLSPFRLNWHARQRSLHAWAIQNRGAIELDGLDARRGDGRTVPCVQSQATPPKGFPSRLEGPMSWTGNQYKGKPELYVSRLRQDDVEHIENAVLHFQALGIPRGLLSPDTFPLPDHLRRHLRSIRHEINSGRGFHVLRGLRPSDYTEEEIIVLYAGLTSHVASHRAACIDHIRYEKTDERLGAHLRPTELPVSMGFHTDADAGSILSMFTQNMGASGGDQHLSSFWRVYNTLMEEQPRVLTRLAERWYWEKPSVADGAGTSTTMQRPIVAQVDGKAQINFGRSFVAGHPRYPLRADAPPLRRSQLLALDSLLAAARRHSFRLDQQVGDMLFVNNLSIMHGRDAFSDGTDDESQRHVLRLWLLDRGDDTSWPIAEALDYRHSPLYDVDPTVQKLMTLTEWRSLERTLRVTVAGTSRSHD